MDAFANSSMPKLLAQTAVQAQPESSFAGAGFLYDSAAYDFSIANLFQSPKPVSQDGCFNNISDQHFTQHGKLTEYDKLPHSSFARQYLHRSGAQLENATTSAQLAETHI